MSHKDLQIELRGDIAIVRLTRGSKRNALSDGLILAIRDAFDRLPRRYAPQCSTARARTSAPGSTSAN